MPIVNREKLLQAIESVRPGLSVREVVEQSNFLIFLNGEVWSFNDELCCHTKSTLDKSFKGAVPAKPLIDLLSKLTVEEVDIFHEGGEFCVSDKKRVKESGIRMEAEITLPITAVEKPTEWKSLHPDFCNAIEVVQQCAGKDESKPSLTCVHIHPKWVESTDRVQIARWHMATGFTSPVLVHHSSIKHITKLGMLEFSETGSWVHFRNGNKLVMSCRRYIDEYKDLSRFLDGDDGTPITLPKSLTEGIDMAEIFSADNADNNHVLITLRPKRLVIKGLGALGWYRERKAMKYAGEPIEFLMSPAILNEVVKRHTDCFVTGQTLKVKSGDYTYITCLTPSSNGNGQVEHKSSKEAEETDE